MPFIRPYRVRADIQTWFGDPFIFELVQDEFKRGYYRGIGEFHISGKAAENDWVKKTVDFAVQHDLYLHAHADDVAVEILMRHNPKPGSSGRIPASGLSTDRVAALLSKYPKLWGELSYRSGIVDGDGKLTPEWRALFERYPDRFLVGSDTWINQRWESYGDIIAGYRAWLAQLSPKVAAQIANGNAKALFGAGKVRPAYAVVVTRAARDLAFQNRQSFEPRSRGVLHTRLRGYDGSWLGRMPSRFSDRKTGAAAARRRGVRVDDPERRRRSDRRRNRVSEPARNGTEAGSTSTTAPSRAITRSSSALAWSTSNLYWKPEQPPPSTEMRSMAPSPSVLRISPMRRAARSLTVMAVVMAWSPSSSYPIHLVCRVQTIVKCVMPRNQMDKD